jgi:hypothetical protein
MLAVVQRRIEEKYLIHAAQFGFPACHSMMLKCMRLTDHVTLNLNIIMSIGAVFLDI